MKKKVLKGRREFIKSTVIGTAGTLLSSATAYSAKKASSGWQDGMQINPNIDNLRVVCCHDPDMVSSNPLLFSFKNQNDSVRKEKVQANLDEMAKALAQEQDAATAWKTIFQLPNKPLNTVRAAIKVNCIETNQMPRIAIVGKVCKELVHIGLSPENITIYDGDDDASGNGKYTSYIGRDLPGKVRVSSKNSLLGGMTETRTPDPDVGSYSCTNDIALGKIDILINCAVNKGHDDSRGGISHTMKNHFGTFTPRPHGHGDLNYLLAINKSDAIIGGNPPRQQLCIIDSIWAMTSGPRGTPNKAPHRLTMGTFAPAIDYLNVYKIRGPIMGRSPSSRAQSVLEKFPTTFGYTKTAFDQLELIDVPPVRKTTNHIPATTRGNFQYLLELQVPKGRFQPARAQFRFTANPGEVKIKIFNPQGKLITTKMVYVANSNAGSILWEGVDSAGNHVSGGTYTVVVSGKHETVSQLISLF